MQNETSKNIKPLMSIVICTYNNAESLAITLQQVLSQKAFNPELVELVVINNNSSDSTAQILDSIDNTAITFRHYFEPRQGISHARNTGFEKAHGEYILYTDDDAEIPQYWLEKYLNKITVHNMDCMFGKISIIWDMPPPWWYETERYQGLFAALDYGDTELQICTKKYPFLSKNVCIKKNCLVEIGGFDPTLGRKGNILTGGEEILAFYRLIEAKKSVYYYPDIIVGHRLKLREYSEENITNQYLACAKPILQIAKLQPGKRFFKKPLGVLENQIKDIMNCTPQLIKAYLNKNKKDFFYQNLRFRRAILIIKFWLKNT
jgi:glycosyltransferase involved in cell wall biosynthesis